MVRLESEKNRDKRLALLDTFLAKEHTYVKELKYNKNVKIISSQADMDETGIIKIQAKDGNILGLYNELMLNSAIQKDSSHIAIRGVDDKRYISISFV